MKLSHELFINMILNHKGRLPINIRKFLPKDRGWEVVAQYTNNVLTFVIIPARIGYNARLLKIRHINTMSTSLTTKKPFCLLCV